MPSLAALGDHLAEEVAVLHGRVPLADFGVPQAQAHVRVGVLQERLHAAARERLDELGGVEPRRAARDPSRARGCRPSSGDRPRRATCSAWTCGLTEAGEASFPDRITYRAEAAAASEAARRPRKRETRVAAWPPPLHKVSVAEDIEPFYGGRSLSD